MRQQDRHWLTGAAFAALAFASVTAAPAAAATGNAEPAKAAAGPVKPYYGNLRPFYGNLRPFYGNLRPFYGNLRPFWGNLRPFWGDTAAFYGDLSTFWGVDNPVVGSGAPQYAKVGDYWTVAGGTWDQIFKGWDATPGNYAATNNQLKSMVASARDFWGASVTAKTGKTFETGFSDAILARYGIDLNNPNSLADLDQTDRAMFFLEWYDGLMNFTGTDHVDHWMKTINWSPSLSSVSGGGSGVTIGILDQTVLGAETQTGQVVQFHGNSTFTDGHGAAVGSLLVGAHDGQGVMGMVPDAKVFAYNPFDSTGTADWADVTRGVQALKASGASVVNMSLGVPGTTFDQGWNGVFSNLATTLILKNTVFVIAAGNDGVTQTKNINWLPINPAFLVVGSVDVEGNISNFSNRPGEACLTTLGILCLPGQKLKDRFLVAPGELILVSDGQGGVTRQIGTSFAAPLVAGAIAMIHDRWPWLKNFPLETANIILDSAKDLGAPGVDGVYGHGLLDVEASQSPLNFNNLIWYSVENGQKKLQTANAVLTTYNSNQQATWDAKGAYFYAFEPLGLLTNRDFAIPLSSKLVGQSVTTNMGAQEKFQAYLLSQMDEWAAGKRRFSDAGPFGLASSGEFAVANPWGAALTVSFAPRTLRDGYRDEGPAYQSRFNIKGERSQVSFGFGDGAPALAATSGFAQAADYDAERGGANPLLGLASGGGYANWSYGITDKLSFSAGALLRDQERDRRLLPGLRVLGNGAEAYQADATHMSLSYKPTGSLTLTGAYTRLHEGAGLLGIQSFDPSDFREGSTTDGYSVSLNWAASSKLSLMATGTMGKTRASDTGGQSLTVGKDGLTTSSYEFGLMGADLFKKGDRVKLSVSQPMFVERGRLDVATVQVVDRETGEIGIVSQSFDISGKRRMAGEALYQLPVSGGQGDVSFFGRVETEGTGSASQGYMTGARYRIAF